MIALAATANTVLLLLFAGSRSVFGMAYSGWRWIGTAVAVGVSGLLLNPVTWPGGGGARHGAGR
ncbi:MAG TPA: hypothetical protein VGT02_00620 [Methylomirabilota bacterium]|nr:hypothetical protein [Methylomirabilota bacterium]